MQPRTFWTQVLLVLTILLCLAGADRAAAPPDPDKLQQAKILFDKGLAAEKSKDYTGAIDCYRQGLKLFPETAVLHYRIGVCQETLGQKEEAIRSLQTFLAEESEGEEVFDARRRLENLLLPKLKPEQKQMLGEAEDNLKAAAELGITEKAAATPIRRAIVLLGKVKLEIPSYLRL